MAGIASVKKISIIFPENAAKLHSSRPCWALCMKQLLNLHWSIFALIFIASMVMLWLTLWIDSTTYSARRAPQACRANLKQLNSAKEQWMVENQKSSNDVPNWDELIGTNKYIINSPSCPSGGKYTLNKASEPPTCNVGVNSTPPHILPQ